MLAARYYGPHDLRVEEVPPPRPPGPGEVTLRVAWCGICGTDLEAYLHRSPWIPFDAPHPLSGQQVPITLGHEFAGEVVAVGPGVTTLREGDRVAPDTLLYCGRCYWCARHQPQLCPQLGALGLMADGGLAEYCLATEAMCVRLPDGVSYEAGACAEPLAVAVRALRRGRLTVGERVAVIGAGAVGLFALQAARAAGASEVFVVEVARARKQIAAQLGAAAVLDPTEVEVAEALRSLCGGIGPDLVVEAAGTPATAPLAVSAARRGGRVVVVGVAASPSTFHFAETVMGEKEVIGSLSHVYDEDFRAAVALLGDGRVRAEPVISHRINLREVVAQGFERLVESKAETVKILVRGSEA